MTEVVEVKTIGEVERIVHASGLWDGTSPVEFSDDGAAWGEAWQPSDEHAHPEFARVTVHRKEVTVPTRVTIRWEEQVPRESDEWAEKWAAAPTRHFGRTARMVAFRQTFRDLIGDMVIEDEDRASAQEQQARDWMAEFAAAETVEALHEIVAAARRERVFTATAEGVELDRAWKSRRRDLTATVPASAPRATPPARQGSYPQSSRSRKPAAKKRKRSGRR